MLSPTHTRGPPGGWCTTTLRRPRGGVTAQVGEPQPLALVGVAISIDAAALAPGGSKTRVSAMDHAPVAVP